MKECACFGHLKDTTLMLMLASTNTLKWLEVRRELNITSTQIQLHRKVRQQHRMLSVFILHFETVLLGRVTVGPAHYQLIMNSHQHADNVSVWCFS